MIMARIESIIAGPTEVGVLAVFCCVNGQQSLFTCANIRCTQAAFPCIGDRICGELLVTAGAGGALPDVATLQPSTLALAESLLHCLDTNCGTSFVSILSSTTTHSRTLSTGIMP